MVADRTGGRMLPPFDAAAANLFTREGLLPTASPLPIWDILVPILLGLIIIDVATRRIAWDWNATKRLADATAERVRGFTVIRKVESRQTLDALEARARGVAQTKFNADGAAAPSPSATPGTLPDPKAKFEASKGVEGDITQVVGGATDKPIPPPPKKIEPKGSSAGPGEHTSSCSKRNARPAEDQGARARRYVICITGFQLVRLSKNQEANHAPTQRPRRRSPSPSSDCDAFRRDYRAVADGDRKAIVGHEEIIDGVLTCLFVGGHALLEGVPGLGKTALIRTLAEALHLKFSRIQFTPDLMPADVIGTNVIMENEHGHARISRSCPARSSPRSCWPTRSTAPRPRRNPRLLEAMQEKQVTAGGEIRKLEAAVLRDGHAEPDRAGRHVSAARSAARPLLLQAARAILAAARS